jgi:diacylglycerol kinase (ATP)
MINTALEKSVDIIIDSYHPLAKIAKDIAAGAVLISSMNAVIVAYFLFVKNGRTSRVLSDVFQTLRELSPYLFVIILLIITLFIVIAKLIINKRYK